MCQITGFLTAIDWNSFFAAGFGAAAGAGIAYFLGRRKDKTDKIDQNYGALVKAQFILISQFDFIIELREKYLDPHRNSPNRTGALKKFKFAPPESSVDVSDLSFCIEFDEPNLLLDITRSQNNFSITLLAIADFNNFRRRLEGAGKDFNSETGQSKVMLWEKELVEFKQLIEAVYDCVDRVEANLKHLILEVRSVIKKHFPKRKALNFDPTKMGQADQSNKGHADQSSPSPSKH